jgi:predicted ATPase
MDSEGALADISADMARLIPGVRRICVEVDKKAGEYSLKIVMANGQEFSSRVVSDGTLRVLALLTMLHDPDTTG